MSKTVKIILAIVGGLFLLGVIAFGLLAYWISQNVGNFEQAAKDASEFGQKTDEAGCLKEALERHQKDTGITASISHGAFLQGCLQLSKPTPNFCDGVPKPLSLMESARWQTEQCKKAGLNDTTCPSLFSSVQQYCERRGNKGKD